MKIKNLIFGIAIFVLTIVVGVYGIRTIYGPGPSYDEFCTNKPIYNEQQCNLLGGEWINYSNEAAPPQKPVPAQPVENGYCDFYTKCEKKYQDIQSIYSKKVFLTALPLGIILIIIGAFAFVLEFVGAGLMAGAVGIILYGVIGFWQFADEWLKFLIALIGLVILIFFSYYLNNREKLIKKR